VKLAQPRFPQDSGANVHEDALASPTSNTAPQQAGLTACLQSLARAHALAVVAMVPLES
jgi:hypothetical protein